MTKIPEAVSLLKSPWVQTFHQLLGKAEENLLLVSPFVKRSQASQVILYLQDRGIQDSIRVNMITDVRPESALSGSTDLEAVVDLSKSFQGFELTHLPSLHAKVYVADRKIAVVTSGNLTNNGLSGNIEYGVAFTDYKTVREIRKDFEEYAQLGARISIPEIAALAEEFRELQRLFNRAQRSVRAQAQRAFKEKLEATHVQLLRQRTKGKTANAIFSETILFLLAKRPISTLELHPLIQSLHPDICDDTVDRVINGEHFGKKWKHLVRNAQQFLKRQGRIRYDGNKWHLVR